MLKCTSVSVKMVQKKIFFLVYIKIIKNSLTGVRFLHHTNEYLMDTIPNKMIDKKYRPLN